MFIAHLFVSVVVIVGLGFAIASTINKLSKKCQFVLANMAINLLFSAFVATFALLMCSAGLIMIASGVVFALVTITAAVLIPILIKKIQARNCNQEDYIVDDVTLVTERSTV